MKKLDGKIGLREFASVIMLTIGIKLTDMTPSLLFENGEQASWMVPLISSLIISIPVFFMLSLLKKYQDKGLIEVIYKITGKYIGAIIGVILFLILLVGTILNSRSYIDVISVMFFRTTPIYFLYLSLMIASAFVAMRGFETIGRTAWLIIPFIKVVLYMLVIYVWEDLNITHLFPLGGPGLDQIFLQSLEFSSIFSELILIGCLFQFVRNYKSFKIGGFIGAVNAVFDIVLFIALYIMVFSYPSVNNITFPFQALTQSANVASVLDHTESIYLAFWAMSSVVHFSLYLYLTVAIFAYTLKLKEPEPLILPFAGFVLLMGLIPENLNQTIFATRENLLVLTSAFLLPLPILLWIIDRIRGKRPL